MLPDAPQAAAQPAPTTSGPPLPEQTGVIGRSTPCLSCGYDLAGLDAGGRCPECAFPAQVSVSQEAILPRRYLHVTSLCTWLVVAPAFALGAVLVTAIGGLSWAGVVWRLFVLSLIPWAIGVCFLAAVRPPADEHAPPPPPPSRIRTAVHVLAAFLFASSLLTLLFAPWLGAYLPNPGNSTISPVWLVTVIAGEVLVLSHMRSTLRLAAQLGSKRLRDSARALLICSVPSAFLVVLFFLGLVSPHEGLVSGAAFALGTAGGLACFLAVLSVCFHTWGDLGTVRAARRDLIIAHTPLRAPSQQGGS